MRLSRFFVLGGLLAALTLFSGCAKYVVTVPLENRLDIDATCRVGSITDELPMDMAEDEKPTLEEVMLFKTHLRNYLAELDFLKILKGEDKDTRYIVNGAIMEYRKGSGAARFFFGALANASAKLG